MSDTLKTIERPLNVHWYLEKQFAECEHFYVVPHFDHMACKNCCGVGTDKNWGVASLRWFRTYDEAVYYKMNGVLPDE